MWRVSWIEASVFNLRGVDVCVRYVCGSKLSHTSLQKWNPYTIRETESPSRSDWQINLLLKQTIIALIFVAGTVGWNKLTRFDWTSPKIFVMQAAGWLKPCQWVEVVLWPLGPLPTFLGPDGADVRRGGARAVGAGAGRGPADQKSWSVSLPRPFAADSKKVH